MSLTPTQIPGGIHNYTYEGAIGVAGVTTQSIDLTVIPEALRKDQHFSDQLVMEAQALDANVTSMSNPVVSNGADGLPATLTFDVTSLDAAGQVQIHLECRHTIGR